MVELILETITPVHVGTGHKYSGAEFVLKDKTLYRVSLDKLLNKLTLDQREDLTERLEDRNFSLTEFLKDKNIALSKIKRYASGFDGPGTPREIAEHIKTNNIAYIPGSSIKGAIRTAILYSQITDRSIEKLSRIFDMNYRQREGELQRFVDGFLSGAGSPSYSSLLKFLQVVDTELASDVCVYTVKSLKSERGGWTWYKRRGREVVTFHETIDAGEKLGCDITTHYDAKIYSDLILGEKGKYIDIVEIKRCIYEFSRDLIEHELEFAAKYQINFLRDFYADLRAKNE
ncbi:MAG: type III-A CRISPR-associated RAMP protein Csm5, partial [Proteobacteria bacterium]|nr:type III-A CRISPR-associated RAMP protein Csm5 [Pseudomonadota bacterium]